MRSRVLLRFERHGAPLALAAIAIGCIALKAVAPPNVPCDGKWVRSVFTATGGCDKEFEDLYWECDGNRSAAAALPLSFEPNAGQAPAAHQFVSRSRSLSVSLDDGDADLTIQGPDGKPATVRLHLEGAARSPEAIGEDQLPGVANYFIGNDRTHWRTNIPSYSRVRFREVYPGIDVVYYGAGGELEHDFVVHPGADPKRIRMELAGADAVRLEADGSALAIVRGLSVSWRKPVLYQQRGGRRWPVIGRYVSEGGNRLSFEVEAYDKSADLVIDPVVAYVSYFGRTGADAGGRIVVDGEGNAYTAGITFDPAFPVTQGAPSVAAGAHGDIMITKFNPQGTAVVYSTHIGGSNADGALGIAIDATGNLYVTGGTDSDDYPVTNGVVKPYLQPGGAPSDPFDCTVTKLNAAGNAILYSTYLGGSANDVCTAIAVDPQGNAYLTGRTNSSNFATTEDAFRRIPRGSSEAFVTKLNPTATAFAYSTVFGGTRDDAGMAIAVDAQGSAYVAGFTSSSFGFPVSRDALQPTWGGMNSLTGQGDAFVLKLNPGGTDIVYSTYLGGNRDESAFGIAVDAQGNAYVAGNTASANFRTTPGAYQTEMRGSGGSILYRAGDAFAAKINPAGTALVYSTMIGGSKDEVATSLAIDAAGNAYIAGSTLSTDFPVSQDALQKSFGGTSFNEGFPTGDAFLTHINPSGSAIVYSTYIGGSNDDLGFGVAVDRDGGIYVSGTTLSSNLPTTAKAAQPFFAGTTRKIVPFGDAFVARFGTPIPEPVFPVIRGFGSAANNGASAVAPGEWIVITGTDLGPATRVNFAAGAGGSVPTALSGTRVLFDGVEAPVFYASAASVQVAVPFALTGKASTQAVVEANGRRSAPLTIPVVASKPTLFTMNNRGTGQGNILNLIEGKLNGPDSPIHPGGWVAVFFTGGGQTSPVNGDGQVVHEAGAPMALPVTVTVAGREASVSYAGAAMGQVAGLYRADFAIPEGVEAGDAEVIVTVGSARSQGGVTVAVRPLPPSEGGSH